MATMNASIPDPMKSWIEERTRDGSFSNVSDYVRHLIHPAEADLEEIWRYGAAAWPCRKSS